MTNSATYVCLLVGVVAAAALAGVGQKASPQPGLSLTPVFFNTEGHTPGTLNVQNTPRFAYAFTNTTSEDVDLLTLSHQSTIVLDGKEYSDPFFYWFGNTRLRPGETWDADITVSEYLPGAWRPTWKWSEAALSEGSHTLVLRTGGKQYGPVSFVWHSQSIP